MNEFQKFQAVNIPRVKVVDEDGEELIRGYYVLHFNRTPGLNDEYTENDVEHIVISDAESDFNMARGLQTTRVAPPCSIQFLDENE